MRGPLLPLLVWAAWFHWLPNLNHPYLAVKTPATSASIQPFCTGNLGENILQDGNFGSGEDNILQNDPGLAPGYTYQLSPPPDDGYYNITNNTSDWGSFANIWVDIGDNSNDPNGYMMVVNANVEPDVFFERTIEICDNTVYEFSADVINLVEPWVEDYILPNMDFLINDEVLFSTGDVPQDGEWKTFGFTFVADPGTNSITLSLRNNAPGGYGNDLALDNISFRPCGPLAGIAFTPFCNDGTARLTAEVEGSSSDLVYQWQESAGDGLTWQNLEGETSADLFLSNPMEDYQYRYFMATSAANISNPVCRFISDVHIVMPVAPLTTLIDTSLCEGNSILIGNSTYAETGSYSDTLQTVNGCDSVVLLELEVHPVTGAGLEEVICAGSEVTIGNNTYSEPGFYLDTLLSVAGCDSIVSLDLTVLEPVTVDLTATICEGESITIGDSTYTEAGQYTTTFSTASGCDSIVQLSLTALDTSLHEMIVTLCEGETFQGQSFTENTTLTLVEMGLNGCDSTTIVYITVSDLVNFAIEGDTAFCRGENTTLNAGAVESYLWSTGVTGPDITVDSSGVFSVTVTDELGCEAEASVEVEQVTIEVEVDVQMPICYGEQDAAIKVTVLNGSPAGYRFALDEGPWQSYPDFTALTSGTYRFKVEDENGCLYAEEIFIPEPEALALSLGEDILMSLGDSVQLQAFVNFDPETIQWEPETGLSCTDCLDPFVSLNNSTAYRLTLIDENGCSISDQLSIFVEKNRDVFIPNAFSPNGDGVNDVFTLFAGGEVAQINNLKIFDRWGALLFEQETLLANDQGTGWDGHFKGKLMPAGVYIYVAEIQFVDGERQLYSGDVALIK